MTEEIAKALRVSPSSVTLSFVDLPPRSTMMTLQVATTVLRVATVSARLRALLASPEAATALLTGGSTSVPVTVEAVPPKDVSTVVLRECVAGGLQSSNFVVQSSNVVESVVQLAGLSSTLVGGCTVKHRKSVETDKFKQLNFHALALDHWKSSELWNNGVRLARSREHTEATAYHWEEPVGQVAKDEAHTKRMLLIHESVREARGEVRRGVYSSCVLNQFVDGRELKQDDIYRRVLDQPPQMKLEPDTTLWFAHGAPYCHPLLKTDVAGLIHHIHVTITAPDGTTRKGWWVGDSGLPRPDVDTSKAGTHTVAYVVKNCSGGEGAKEEREVVVHPPTGLT